MYLFFNRVLFTRWPTSIYWQLKTKRIISQSNKINSVNDLCYYFRFAAKLIIDGIKSLLGNWYTFNIAYDFCWNWQIGSFWRLDDYCLCNLNNYQNIRKYNLFWFLFQIYVYIYKKIFKKLNYFEKKIDCCSLFHKILHNNACPRQNHHCNFNYVEKENFAVKISRCWRLFLT